MKAIINGKVILKDKVEQTNIFIEGDKIVEISSRDINDEEVIDAEGYYVSPGFIDVHTHGRGGSDTMNNTIEDLETIATTTLTTGVTSFTPTTMTMPVADIKKSLEIIKEYQPVSKGARIIGCHLEGPFINEAYKGAQSAENIIAPTIENYKSFVGDNQDISTKITIAPEIDGAIELIEYLQSVGTVVSIGHTNATYEEAIKAINAGATSTTHTYNAMTPLTHRAPGVVGASMTDDSVYAELILDGIHVSFPAAKALLRSKGKDKVILITDSMEAAGLPDGKYKLGTNDVYVKDKQARLIDGTLAGSVLSLNDAVNNAYKNLDLSINEAVNLATLNVANSINRNDIGEIAVGKKADFAIFDDDIHIQKVILDGEVKIDGRS